MSDLDTQAATNLAVTIKLISHLTTYRYIRWDSAVEFDHGITFEPAPELVVDSNEQNGGTKDEPFTITIRSERPPFDKLLRPYSHAPVRVEIGECDPDDPDDTWFHVWSGEIVSSVRNAQGIKLLTRATLSGIKRRLIVPLGVHANETCVNVFGDHVCGATVPEHEVTIESVDGQTITISGYTPPRDTYFRFGEIEVGGLRMGIARQVDNETLVMTRRPPPEWIDAAAIARPGCDKRYRVVEGVPEGDCVLWERTGRFTGYGVKMPNHNPIFENPA